MLGVLGKLHHFAVNPHARDILHPPGVEKEKGKWVEPTPVRPEDISLPQSPQNAETSYPPLPPGVFVSASESPTQSSNVRRRIPLAHSRTRSPSRERMRDTSLRLYRTLTNESGISPAASTSDGSHGIIGRIRRWTLGSNDTIERSQPDPGPSNISPFHANAPISSPSPSWTTSAATPNTTLLLNSTPNPIPAIEEAYVPQPHQTQLPRLQHPEPSMPHAEYPNYTPGGGDSRWHVRDGLEEGGLHWIGPVLYVTPFIYFGFDTHCMLYSPGMVEL